MPKREMSTGAAVAVIAAAFAVMVGAGIAGNVSTPCATEDSTWCTWHADTQGNGQGRSFVTLWDGATIYLP